MCDIRFWGNTVAQRLGFCKVLSCLDFALIVQLQPYKEVIRFSFFNGRNALNHRLALYLALEPGWKLGDQNSVALNKIESFEKGRATLV